MLDREVIAAYAKKRIRWLGPLNADGPLTAIVRSVSDAELEDHPQAVNYTAAYRPTNQPKDEPPRYQGVLRPAAIGSELHCSTKGRRRRFKYW